MIEVPQRPAPWHLTGRGYILLYKLKKSFIENHGIVPPFLQGKFTGGFGCIMLVDYVTSDVGPYSELLFIPGKFNHKGKKLNTISKIYVSTIDSVVNGRNNWGIPKEKAEFVFDQIDKHHDHIVITMGAGPIAEFSIRSGRLSFPVNTRLLPFPLVQKYEDKFFYTTFAGRGKGRFALIEKISINSKLFPDVSSCKLLAALKIEPFDIEFPRPEISNS
ncbi:MAG: acetoacetate decarboxylase family protein [Smithellaceae bacterium]